MGEKRFERFYFHFEPKTGWMNDPNGLVFFRGKYHAFFQHYPHAPHWGQMHWGHAVSKDLIHWVELPIALYPDKPYENDGGCFSGSAMVKDDRLYLFYTSVSHERKQTQSVAFSDDGIHFTKYEGNPVIPGNPLGSEDFRDPKVTRMGDTYYMVVGSGDSGSGKVLLFSSDDLLHWAYQGVLFEGAEFAPCIECPDFFRIGDKYVLMFSKMNESERSTYFVVGDFRDGKLVDYHFCRPEWGPDFYAPQTFLHEKRRIMIGWMYHWGKTSPEGCPFAGALSVPRELTLVDGQIRTYPVSEFRDFLCSTSPYLDVDGNALICRNRAGEITRRELPWVDNVAVLQDTKSMEVFVNNGEYAFSWWLE